MVEKLHRLYKISWTEENNKQKLYYKSSKKVIVNKNKLYLLSKNNEIDLLTYFNSFCLKKWVKYTTIEQLIIKGYVKGHVIVEINIICNDKKIIVYRDTVFNNFNKVLDIKNINGDILGIKITTLEESCIIENIEYIGKFNSWQNKNIGVVICTYKREKYIQRTIKKLKSFNKENKWLSVLVVDNGNTLSQDEFERLKIIHNRNYGGSGGFTRGIIENLNEEKNDYVLLMDDDIDLDITTLKRTHSLLGGLKAAYRESFVAGAMLKMEEPYIQYESTAYWNKIKICSLGHNFDLSKADALVKNMSIGNYENQYAAWWYCCIPLENIKKIGLPLPVFIKGDDLEYSLRNNKEILTLNGIGVWHEAFEKKNQPWINYFADRNMFIMNHYAEKCGFFTLVGSLFLRIMRRIIYCKKIDLYMINSSLYDYRHGLEYMTQKNVEEKLRRLYKPVINCNSIVLFGKLVINFIVIILNYKTINKSYLRFRKEKLSDSKFWNNYYEI